MSDSDSSSDDDAPIVTSSNANNNNKSKNNTKKATTRKEASSDDSSSDDDDIPINQLNINKKQSANESESSSDDDVPLISKRQPRKKSMSVSSSSSPISPRSNKKRKRSHRFRDSDSDGSDDDDDKDQSSSDDDDDEPIVKATQIIRRPPKKKQRLSSPKSSSSNSSTPRKRSKMRSDAPGYLGRECHSAQNYAVKPSIIPLKPQKGALKWWEHEDDSVVSYSKSDDDKKKIKWRTLDHNGVVFAPKYVAHGIPIKYKGKEIKLSEDQEEIATMFALMIETDYAQKDKFKKNFFREFQKILRDKRQSVTHPQITELDECDFRDIYDWYQNKKEAEKIKKKDPEYKKKLKDEKERFDQIYGYAIVDGIREKVGNYKVEPPGLFRGRGEHPKMGMLKKRIKPSHIILNIGENTPIPPCPIEGEQWGGIIHDQTVTYIAKWVENINGSHKMVYLGASSKFKGQNDRNKYEKARLLKTKIDGIRKDYESKLSSKNTMVKQLATAVWMIDKLSIRVGNEKDTDEEADTVGVCSLRKEHITLLAPESYGNERKNNDNDDESSSDDDDEPLVASNDGNKIYKITLDFLGKDSMRYHNTMKVPFIVWKNLKSFLNGKKNDMDIFHQIDSNKVNEYLKSQMEGLTAKVFRTHNASTTLQSELSKAYHANIGKVTAKSTLDEKIFFYNWCNMQVAILCNHQRSVSKTHSEQLERMDQQIQDVKDAIDELQEELDIKQGKKKKKKGKKKKKKKKNGDDDDDTPTKKKRERSEEQLINMLKKKKEMLKKKELKKAMKEDNKEVALGTSKINYMDPRITVAWAKKMEVPIEKLFNRSLLDKFPWAMQSVTVYNF